MQVGPTNGMANSELQKVFRFPLRKIEFRVGTLTESHYLLPALLVGLQPRGASGRWLSPLIPAMIPP